MAFSGVLAWFSLPDLPFAVPPEYLLIRNSLWTVWGLAAAVGTFLGKRWAPGVIIYGGSALVVWYWVDRIFLAQSDYSRINWPISALATALAIALVAWILSRPVVRNYFQENGK